MFQSGKFNQDISSWDVSNVTSMSYMFGNAREFNQDISSWDVSKVTNMQYMFGFTSMDQDLGQWNVGQVTNMRGMFNGVNLSVENYGQYFDRLEPIAHLAT